MVHKDLDDQAGIQVPQQTLFCVETGFVFDLFLLQDEERKRPHQESQEKERSATHASDPGLSCPLSD